MTSNAIKKAVYGSWKSPITSSVVSGVSSRRGDLQINKFNNQISWYESLPNDGGRYTVLEHDGTTKQNSIIVNDTMNIRTRVHEYGGGSYCTLPPEVTGSLAVDFKTQQLFHININNDRNNVKALTTSKEPFRYADFIYDNNIKSIFSVREDHTNSEPSKVVNTIVSIPFNPTKSNNNETTDTDNYLNQNILCNGYDFFSTPRVSPNSKFLSWICWNHPNMPWDKTELWMGELNEEGTSIINKTCLCGNSGKAESVIQPLFSPDNKYLYFITDGRNGFWNLHRYVIETKTIECVLEKDDVETGGPQWQFGRKFYDICNDGTIHALVGKDLYAIDVENNVIGTYRPKTGTGEELAPSNIVSSIFDSKNCFIFAGSPTTPSGIYHWNLTDNNVTLISEKANVQHVEYFTKPKLIEFPTANDKTAFAQLYLPKNPLYEASSSEARPPLLIKIHGGPTSSVNTTFRIDIQYWTSRGFAVCDVDYGGSTGYGREYRERLNDNWGIVDIEDCCNCAEYLAKENIVNGNQLAIDGGSAGGFTTLACLTLRSTFKAGTSLYGVADLEALARDTHKFESRYLDGLIGPYPQAKDIYDQRSPISNIDGLNCPLLLLQGDEDMIVPLNQATMMKEACDEKKIPCALFVFEGEQHGFRKAENIQKALDYELSFYGQIFGFETDVSDNIKKEVASKL